MSRILKSYDKSIFKISDHFIKVEFSFSIKKDSSIIASGDENGNDIGDDNRVLSLLEKQPEITAKKMSEQLSMSPRKISRIIKRLRENNTIIRIGSDRKGYWEIRKNKDITNKNLANSLTGLNAIITKKAVMICRKSICLNLLGQRKIL